MQPERAPHRVPLGSAQCGQARRERPGTSFNPRTLTRTSIYCRELPNSLNPVRDAHEMTELRTELQPQLYAALLDQMPLLPGIACS
jgi:hypothetical protein